MMKYIVILISGILLYSCTEYITDSITIEKEHKELFDSGRIKAFGTALNGKKIGEWKFKWDNDSIMEYAVIGHYLNDVQHGKWIYFNMFQDTTTIGHYHHGQKNGEWKFITGQTQSIYPYIKGEMTGTITKFENEKIYETGEVVDRRKIHGTWYITNHFGEYVFDEWYSDSLIHPTEYIPKFPYMDSAHAMINFNGE